MKLLLDQGLPRSAAQMLRAKGIDTIHVSEIGYSTADDVAILQKGRDEERIIVTLDADFHALLALSEASSPSVIRIRIEGLKAYKVVPLLENVLNDYGQDLALGAIITLQPQRLRIRRLPIR